ncbi:MAG TPA: CHRD domain-containing protein, partial [Polyangiales bacterium]|nr:CHRD domain-containing protein [Polyangiales bacterium]
LCLSLSAALLACDDDEVEGPGTDASASDGGRDASADSQIDSAAPPLDASKTDAAPDDAAVRVDAAWLPDGGPAYTQYEVTLTTAAESPVCPNAAPAAAGSATLVLGYDESYFYVTNLIWQNLSSAVVSAHVHYGAAGTSGPIVVPLEVSNPGSGNGAGNAQTYQAKPDAPATFAAFVAELKAGKAYINVHTGSCPNGEIRGQIAP